jgi:hypothetical protein
MNFALVFAKKKKRGRRRRNMRGEGGRGETAVGTVE